MFVLAASIARYPPYSFMCVCVFSGSKYTCIPNALYTIGYPCVVDSKVLFIQRRQCELMLTKGGPQHKSRYDSRERSVRRTEEVSHMRSGAVALFDHKC